MVAPLLSVVPESLARFRRGVIPLVPRLPKSTHSRADYPPFNQIDRDHGARPAPPATSDRGRGQARPFGLSDLAAVLATCHRPRRRGRGVVADEVALERGRLDAVIAGLLFMAGMRRSELSTLRWTDVVDSSDGDGILVTIRRSKTNQVRAR